MHLLYFQKGFNYSQDGPGNRLVYHLQGCNLHCPWCANPEGMPFQPPLMQHSPILPTYLCPHGAISAEGVRDRQQCQLCTDRQCLTRFRNTHLTCAGKQTPIGEIAKEIQDASPLFIDGGGVTFTGGEATMQFEPLKLLLELLSDTGIHTAIETNGTNPRLPELIPYLRYCIGDYKHYDAKKLRTVTGAELSVIERNLTTLAQAGIPMLVRILLVHHFNDSPADIDGFLSAIQPLHRHNPKLSIEFLSYHEYGKIKWEQCGLPYPMEDGFVTPDRVKAFEAAFLAAGIPVIKT